MRTAIALVVGLALAVVVACSSVKPVPIRVGDICEECSQPIENVKIAAEIVRPAGSLPLKFRTVSCMARYLQEHSDTPGTLFVTDYATGRLFEARLATFVKGQIDENTRAMDYYAFSDVKAAVAFGKKNDESSTDWPAILQVIAAQGK
jgi:hypothetical protein